MARGTGMNEEKPPPGWNEPVELPTWPGIESVDTNIKSHDEEHLARIMAEGQVIALLAENKRLNEMLADYYG